jgi:polyphenol oxidase
MVCPSYVRCMIAVHRLDVGPNVRAGITLVNTTAESLAELAFDHGRDAADVITVRQRHGADIFEVSGADVPTSDRTADALITGLADRIIGVNIADCCGVLMNDPAAGVVAAVHSGWRGTVQRITVRTIERMIEQWDCDPARLHVALSPCASGRNYEVGIDVAEQIAEFCTPREGVEGKWLFDNKAAIKAQVIGMGVPQEQILVDPVCTLEDERFQSHRRQRGVAGRNFAFIVMTP